MHRGVRESKRSEGEQAEAAEALKPILSKAGAHAEYYTHGLRRQNAPDEVIHEA